MIGPLDRFAIVVTGGGLAFVLGVALEAGWHAWAIRHGRRIR